MDIIIGKRSFDINEIQSFSAADPDLIFINLKDGTGRCSLLDEKDQPASAYLKEMMKSFSMLTNQKTSIEKSKYPIYSIKLSSLEEIRYWYDELGKLHVAVWDNGICIVTDTEDIADTFRNVVKYILSLKENSDENKQHIRIYPRSKSNL